MSQIVLIILYVFLILFAKCAEKKDNKFLLYMIIVVLSFAAGLRNRNVGIDTESYIYSIENGFPYSWLFDEVGFRFTANSIFELFHDTTWVMLFCAIVTDYCIVRRLWDFKEDCSFSFMLFLYMTIHFLGTMNIMRQYVAVALVFWGTRFLEKKQYIIFGIIMILATTLHTTAVLGGLFLAVYIWENASNRHKKWLFLLYAAIVPVVLYGLYIYEAAHINNYFSQSINNINITYIYRMLTFVFLLFMQVQCKQLVFKSNRKKARNISKPITIRDKEVLFYGVGLILSGLGMFFHFLSRIGIYYFMYELVFWGKLVKSGRNKDLGICMISVFAIYEFLLEVIYNGSQIFPYGIHWF